MKKKQRKSTETTPQAVYARCLCLGTHRAARVLGRRFDEAFAPLGIRHGQFSLMMSLDRHDPPRLGETADFLAMDRTTLTANLKPLERMGYVSIVPDPNDGRSRRLVLNESGRQVLKAAIPVWRAVHDAVAEQISGDGRLLRRQLRDIAAGV